MKIIGSYVSPYVRKVLVCLELKGIDYEVDPITPFFGNDEFERLSPLRRIPVLIDDELVLTNSTVIAEYLDETYPDPPLLPEHPKERARARWLEEFADTRLGDVFIWGLFYPKFVHPIVWKEPGDQERIDNSLSTEIPAALDYLECELPESGYLFGSIGLADIAIASFFRNGCLRRIRKSMPITGPRTARFVAEVLAHPTFAKAARLEQIQCRRRSRASPSLDEAGAKLTVETYGERRPRKGVMRLCSFQYCGPTGQSFGWLLP